jgi:hypothetical protein
VGFCARDTVGNATRDDLDGALDVLVRPSMSETSRSFDRDELNAHIPLNLANASVQETKTLPSTVARMRAAHGSPDSAGGHSIGIGPRVTAAAGPTERSACLFILYACPRMSPVFEHM